MSLQNINKDLLELESSLDKLKSAYPSAARAAATARVNHELAFATAVDQISHEAFLERENDPKFKQTVAESDAKATLRTAKYLREYRESEAELSGIKMQIDVLQSILMSTQSRTKLELIENGLINAQV